MANRMMLGLSSHQNSEKMSPTITNIKKVNELRHKKICLRCVRPGLAHHGLYNLNRWLEA